jgi:hypothetical protein
LRHQLGATRAAVGRLVGAHVRLAREEAGEIVDEVKRVAVLAGIAFGLVFLVGLLLPIGLLLFLGEWLFGSIGWGVLDGTLLLVTIAVACVLVAIGSLRGGQVGQHLVVGIIVGVIVGVVLGLNLTNQAWARLGDAVLPTVSPDVRPLVTAVVVLAIVLGVLGLLAGLRRGGGAAVGGLVGGAIVGVIVGAVTATALGAHVGAAIGLTVALIVWLGLDVATAVRQGVDTEALRRRFWPDETIEATKETLEWVREQTPLGRRS